MADNKTISMENLITEKMVRIHMSAIAGVCLAFGAINIISGAALVGVLIILLGIALPGVVLSLKDKQSNIVRGTILTQAQLCIIMLMSIIKHELHGMFPLMITSMAVGSIYFNEKNLKLHIILMDIVSVLGLFLNDLFYGGADLEFLIKGIVAMNVGGILLIYLIRCCVKFISQAQAAQKESAQMLDRVNEEMSKTNLMTERRNNVVVQIAEVSEKLGGSASLMEQIAVNLSSGSEEQSATIAEITRDMAKLSEENARSLKASEKASEAAKGSTEELLESNRQVRSMVEAMAEINDSSKKIESIIKTIEDIAFQTNILALNAAVEAARAGAAGKGFAVVADEVRNLATKSAEAANSTSALIHMSMESVDRGTEIANNVAAKMENVIGISRKSSENAKEIADITRAQSEAADSVKHKMEQMSVIAQQSAQTSVESAELARSVTAEAENLNTIVKKFN